MKMTMIGTVAVAALAIAGTGCGKKNDAPAAANAPAAAKAPAADPNEVLVTVNGAKLTRGEIDAVVDKQLAAQNVPAAQMDQARKYFSQQFAQAFIMKTLALEAAKKAGMGTVTPERRKARQDEIVKANSGAPGAPKTFDEFVAKHPLGADFVRKDLGQEPDMFDSPASAFAALKAGKVDAVIADIDPAKAVIKGQDGYDISDLLTVEEYAVAIKKGQPELLATVNKVIQGLLDSGELDKITDDMTAKANAMAAAEEAKPEAKAE